MAAAKQSSPSKPTAAMADSTRTSHSQASTSSPTQPSVSSQSHLSSIESLPAEDAFEEPPPDLEKAQTRRQPLDWESDPDNPYNWSRRKRIYHVSVPAVFAFICTVGSSIYTPGTQSVVAEFNVSTTAATLGLSLYVLGIAFGPIIAAPLSEHLGRRPVYITTFLASSLFTLGAGFSQTYQALFACRFFAGFFAGPVLSVGTGTIADCYPPVYRCICIALYAGPAFFGPVLAPVMAGYAVQHFDWRWTQWILLFWSALGIFYIIPFKETHKAAILRAREKRNRKEKVAQGAELKRTTSVMSKASARKGMDELKKTFAVLLFRPIRMLCTEVILFSFSLYIAFNFAIFYSFFSVWPLVFQGIYGFDLGTYGLTWLGLFVGAVEAIIVIWLCDMKIYQPRHWQALKEGKSGIAAENRLYPAMFACYGIPVALFWFGWTARADVHWICPIIASSFFTMGNLCVFVSGMMYLTDVYGAHLGASALAANGLFRYLLGTAFPLFSRQMFTNLGIGWASSLLAFVSVALCVIPYVLFKYGPQLRARSGRP